MSPTADVKSELTGVRDARPTARVAELTAILRFSGGLHSIAGRVAVEAELDSDPLARRVARDILELYGVRPDEQEPGPQAERDCQRGLHDARNAADERGQHDDRGEST